MHALIVSLAFLFILLAFANPLSLWMPTELQYLTVAAFVVVAALFAGLFFKEHARDEREEALRARAARVGYLVGVGALVVGVSFQALSGAHVDPWLLGALGVMVLARLFIRAKAE